MYLHILTKYAKSYFHYFFPGMPQTLYEINSNLPTGLAPKSCIPGLLWEIFPLVYFCCMKKTISQLATGAAFEVTSMR